MTDCEKYAQSSSQSSASNHIEGIIVAAPVFNNYAENRWTSYDAEEQKKLTTPGSFADFVRGR